MPEAEGKLSSMQHREDGLMAERSFSLHFKSFDINVFEMSIY